MCPPPPVSSSGNRFSPPKESSPSKAPLSKDRSGVRGRLFDMVRNAGSRSLNRDGDATLPMPKCGVAWFCGVGSEFNSLWWPILMGLATLRETSGDLLVLMLSPSLGSWGMSPKSWAELSVLCSRSWTSFFSRYSTAVVRRDFDIMEYCAACASIFAKWSSAVTDMRAYFSRMRPKPPRSPAPSTSEPANSHDLNNMVSFDRWMDSGCSERLNLHKHRPSSRDKSLLYEIQYLIDHQTSSVDTSISQLRLAGHQARPSIG